MQYFPMLLLAIFVKDIVHIAHIVHIADASNILLLLSSIASFIAMVLIADAARLQVPATRRRQLWQPA